MKIPEYTEGEADLPTEASKSEVFKDAKSESAKESEEDRKLEMQGIKEDKSDKDIKKAASSCIPLPTMKTTSRPITPKQKTPDVVKKIMKPQSSVRLTTAAKVSLETQFRNKKRRLDLLKKELTLKQKPMMELYQGLLDLKKKLEQNGASVQLEEINFIDCKDEGFKKFERLSSPTSSISSKRLVTKIDEYALESLKETILQIPMTFMSFCKDVVRKRSEMLEIMNDSPHIVQERLPMYIKEDKDIQSNLESLYSEQEKRVNELIKFFHTVVESCNVSLEIPKIGNEAENEIKNLKEQLAQKEEMLKRENNLVTEMQKELFKKSAVEEEAAKTKQHVTELRHKIRVGYTVCVWADAFIVLCVYFEILAFGE